MDTTHKHVISDKHKFVYHEIQKCATRSMLDYFVFKPQEDYGARRVFGSKQLEGLDGYYHFTFVRHPLHRLVSAYISKFVVYNQHPTKPGIRHKYLYMHMPFDEFVRFVYATPDIIADVHFKSQHEFIPEGCRVGRVEYLNESFSHILNEIGLPRHNLKEKNVTESSHWEQYFTDETMQMALDRYDVDMALYGYDRVDEISGDLITHIY